jgi:hypothetical protein
MDEMWYHTRTGLCYTCAELTELPYEEDGHYFCSEECMHIYEEDIMEENDE